ncbi:MAG: (2Fe-2S)-binding protein, partial [Pyrinomonadaceae bacterium]|nr:(2Fe-2S)-binding protein [Pyrinomonadaceae bacterium]
MKTAFENYLSNFNQATWETTVMNLLPEIHDVDRNAAQIWFKFFPLNLFRAFEVAENKDELAKKLIMQGKFELREQINASHSFLYAHRFWNEAKAAIIERAGDSKQSDADLSNEIRAIAKSVAAKINKDASLTISIVAVGLMTLVQVGLDGLKKSGDAININKNHHNKSPEKVLAERAKDDSQGVFGFLKSDVDKNWTVTWDENENNAKFKLINEEEIASAAARDNSQDWKAMDERRPEGVIPVECRSAACGTCWVGVLGGAEKLSDVTPREAKSMRRFGYIISDEPKPLIRLACMAQASGAVSIIPRPVSMTVEAGHF